MQHSCKFPCIYGSCEKCVVSKRKGYIPTEEELKRDGEWIKGKSLTIDDLNRMNKKWNEETNGDELKIN